jgi:hypothetical protein
MLGLLLDRLNWTLRLTEREDDTMDEENTGNNAVESDDHKGFWTATFTNPDGETTTTNDFGVFQANVDLSRDTDGVSEVTAGLSEAIEDAKREFQLTVEVPTKTLVCPNCDHPNDVPVWSFAELRFSGDLEPLSGEYALGHQCVKCGFPH